MSQRTRSRHLLYAFATKLYRGVGNYAWLFYSQPVPTDYTVDILGGATGLNYASDYRDVEGIIVPTKRRVYAYEGDYQLVKEPLLVAIDMGEITLMDRSAISPRSRYELAAASSAKPPGTLSLQAKNAEMAEPFGSHPPTPALTTTPL